MKFVLFAFFFSCNLSSDFNIMSNENYIDLHSLKKIHLHSLKKKFSEFIYNIFETLWIEFNSEVLIKSHVWKNFKC